MSAGDTPEMRDACAIVLGLYFASFWRHSIVSPLTFEKSKFSGMIRLSNFFSFSAAWISLSM